MKRIGKASLLLGTIALIALGCSKDGDNSTPEDQEVTQAEIQTVLEIEELSGVADSVLMTVFGENETGKSAKKEECYEAVYSNTGFTVSFNECSVEGSENINGSLTVTYKVGEESTSFTTIYDNLSVGSLTINGSRSFTLHTDSAENSVYFTIVSNMSIKLADGSIVEENGNKTFGIVFESENFDESVVTVDGDWTVKADGNTYSVDVTSLISSAFNCDYLQEGAISLNKNGLEVDIDFGDGTCDDIATIEYPDGTIEEFKLKK